MKNRLLELLPDWAKNKYIVSLVAFALLLTVIDSNNMFKLIDRKKAYKDLKEQRAYYESEIERIKQERAALTNDAKLLEKFARETYMMKKANEDVFIIVTEE